MGQAYTPGLKVLEACRWSVRRTLPIEGEVLVSAGQTVDSQYVIARTLQPGDAVPVNIARGLAVQPGQVPRLLSVKEGEAVGAGAVLARTGGLFGWFPKTVVSPCAGTIESISRVTGQVILRQAPQAVELKAYLAGHVRELLPGTGAVIEADVSLVQGIFGIGGEAYGTIVPVCSRPDQEVTPDLLTEQHRGAIVIGGGYLSAATIARARQLGISAIVSGGMDDHDLRDLLGYDLGVAITGTENLGLTVILTEGFGAIAMARRTFELLVRLRGAQASANGATQIRAGVMRPEVVIPLTDSRRESVRTPTESVLSVGAPVRVIREPDFGELGQIVSLPHEPKMLASESKARVAEVALSDGRRVFVPRANLERVET